METLFTISSTQVSHPGLKLCHPPCLFGHWLNNTSEYNWDLICVWIQCGHMFYSNWVIDLNVNSHPPLKTAVVVSLYRNKTASSRGPTKDRMNVWSVQRTAGCAYKGTNTTAGRMCVFDCVGVNCMHASKDKFAQLNYCMLQIKNNRTAYWMT